MYYRKEAFLAFLLDRSSPRPLNMMTYTALFINTKIFVGHWHRVARLDIEARGSDELTRLHRFFQSSSMSSLGDLVIVFDPLDDADTEYNVSQLQLSTITSAMLPMLHTLTSPFFCLPWFSVLSLRHITVSRSTAYGDPRMQGETVPLIYDTLDRSPRLVTLRILDQDTFTRHKAPHFPRTVHLPHLRHLVLRRWHASVSKRILRDLKFPSTALFEVEGYNWLDPDPTGLLPPHPFTADRLSICVRPDESHVEFHTRGAPRLRVCGSTHRFDMRALARAVPAADAVALQCTSVRSHKDPEWHDRDDPSCRLDWSMLLDGSPKTAQLMVRGFPPRLLFAELGGDDRHWRLGGQRFPPPPPPPLCQVLKEVTYGWDCDQKGEEPVYSYGAYEPPTMRLQDVVEIIAPYLVRRAALGGSRLQRLVLEKYVGTDTTRGDALSDVYEDGVRVDDILASLRRLVEGTVE